MKLIVFLVPVFFLISISCQRSQSLHVGKYHLTSPNRVIELPKKLKEISGLTYLDDKLYAVQDEKGNLYQIDLQTEEIKKFDFARDGDFESIETLGEYIFAMTSKGSCYRLQIHGDSVATTKLERFIKKNRNLEGMSKSTSPNELLFASKMTPQDSIKEILRFDLIKNIIHDEPYFQIDQSKINNEELRLFATYSFNPSALALHPISNQLYVLSHPSQQLLIIDQNKSIVSLNKLPTTIFKQPEGICFDTNGILYISTEGRDGSAKIFEFKPK